MSTTAPLTRPATPSGAAFSYRAVDFDAPYFPPAASYRFRRELSPHNTESTGMISTIKRSKNSARFPPPSGHRPIWSGLLPHARGTGGAAASGTRPPVAPGRQWHPAASGTRLNQVRRSHGKS